MNKNFENRASQAAKALQSMRSAVQPNNLDPTGANTQVANPQSTTPQLNANRVNTQTQGLQQQGMGQAQAVNQAAINPQNAYAKGGPVSEPNPPSPDQIQAQVADAKIDPSALDVYTKQIASVPASKEYTPPDDKDKMEQMFKDYSNPDYQKLRASLTQKPQKYAKGGDVKESIKNLPLKDIIKMLATHPGLAGQGLGDGGSSMSDTAMKSGGAVKSQANSASGLMNMAGNQCYADGGSVTSDSVENNDTGSIDENNLATPPGNVNMAAGGQLEEDSITGYGPDGTPITQNADGSQGSANMNELLGRPKNAPAAMAKGGMDNNPPPGSLSKEVADDIPAQLSEGEFVFSADVVRYYGLQKLNAMMEYAREELAEMEGQGNIRSPGDGKNPDQSGQFLQDKKPNMNAYDDQGGNGGSDMPMPDEDDNVSGLLKECMGGANYAAGGTVYKAKPNPSQVDDQTGNDNGRWDKQTDKHQEQVLKEGQKSGEVFVNDLKSSDGITTNMATGGGISEENFAKGGIVGATMGSLTPKKNEGLIPSGIKLSTQGGAKGTGTEMYGLKKLTVKAAEGGLLQNFNLGDEESPFQSDIDQVSTAYPKLADHLKNTQVQYGQDQGDGRQLEFYPPWEQQNPNPGKSTIEIYNKDLKGKDLQNAIAGDSLHLMGSIDPSTGKPVDENYYNMKQGLLSSLTPQQQTVDKKAYEEEKSLYKGNAPSFEDWMQSNRGDAYIRGYITPDKQDEWRKNKVYTPEQEQSLQNIMKYISN